MQNIVRYYICIAIINYMFSNLHTFNITAIILIIYYFLSAILKSFVTPINTIKDIDYNKNKMICPSSYENV